MAGRPPGLIFGASSYLVSPALIAVLVAAVYVADHPRLLADAEPMGPGRGRVAG